MPELSVSAAALPATPARPAVWRWLRPSLTDVFFVFVVYWLCIAAPGSWQALLKDGDTGMHLRTGDWIVAHRQAPVHDIFSYTQPGAPWYAFQWGSATLYSVLNSAWGIRAVAFMSGIVIALWVAALMQAMIAIRVHGILAALLALAGANAASIHYLARPHVFTMLFLACSVWLVETDRDTPSKRIWLLAPLAAIWTNVHSGFVILPAYLAAVIAGAALEDRRFKRARRYGFVLAGCAGATILNPYGIRLHLHILSFLSGPVATRLVDEYQSPQFRGEPMYWFLALLFGSLMIAGIELRARRYIDALVILLFAAAALAAARNIPLFVTAALPVAGRSFTRIWNASGGFDALYRQGAAFASRCSGFSAWSAAAVALVAVLTPSSAWPRDLDPQYFPLALIERNTGVLESRRVFTTDQWGDDLIYRFHGKVPVFLDGRSDFYPQAVVADYLTMMNGGTSWKTLLDRYRIDAVLAPAGSPLSSLLAADSQWSEQARDGSAVLFVRR